MVFNVKICKCTKNLKKGQGFLLFIPTKDYLCTFNELNVNRSKVIIKVLLGLVFIVSAILKLIDMDKFELYIYSYHFFNLNFAFLVARAAIILELVLGIGLVSNRFHKTTWWISMAMLAGYTLFLAYAQIIGRTDNCHCFGELVDFNPWQSILKNLVLMGLFAIIYKMDEKRPKRPCLMLASSVVLTSVIVFAVSPPDNFIPQRYFGENVNGELLAQALSEPPLSTYRLGEGRQMVCFFSTQCEYCQLAAHKISLMQQHFSIPHGNITYVFIGTEEGIKEFYAKSESSEFRNVLYEDAVRLLKVIDGKFPTIVLVDNGSLVHEYGLHNMKESEIKAFFTPQ